MDIIISTVFQGLIYAVLCMGVFISYRVLKFADMTAEGSFTLGGSVCAVMILHGMNPVASLIVSGFLGTLAGFFTGILNTKLKIQDILSGILVMISLYSVNLRIMKKANLSILGRETIFKFNGSSTITNFIFALGICGILVVILWLFFKTELGLAIKATGDNEQMAKSLEVNTDFSKIFALMVSSFLCALSGALVVENQGYSDVNMGVGVIVIALSSIIIGEALIKKYTMIIKLLSVVVGTICYKFMIYFVLSLGMNPSDLKLFTALIATTLLGLPSVRKYFKGVKNKNVKA
ncbi:MAG: ABC transporter permease [Acutalibacteraceae bacterium]